MRNNKGQAFPADPGEKSSRNRKVVNCGHARRPAFWTEHFMPVRAANRRPEIVEEKSWICQKQA